MRNSGSQIVRIMIANHRTVGFLTSSLSLCFWLTLRLPLELRLPSTILNASGWRRHNVILKRWSDDRPAALEALRPIVYSELRKIAGSYLRRERPDHTLQPTALINEAYLRLVRQDAASIEDRSHFYGRAARMMRQILVDAARSYRAEKRGQGNKVQLGKKIDIGGGVSDGSREAWDFLALHEALDKLKVHNERTAQVVELRFSGGLQLDEISASLAISLATVKRDLTLGEAWLRRALTGTT